MADEGEEKATGTTPQAGQTDKRDQTEWTASDSRGPLNAAAEGALPEPAPEALSQHEVRHEPLPHETAAEPIHEPMSEPPSSESHTSPADQSRPVPVVAILLGLIIGALIGAGSAALMYAYGAVGSDSSQVTAQVTAQVTTLASRVDTLEKRPETQPEIDALKSQISAQATQAFDPAPLQQKIASLQSDLDALKQTAGKADADDTSLGSKVAAIGGSVAALKAQGADVKDLGGKIAALAATLDGLKKEDATTQASLASLQGAQKSLQDGQTSLQDGQKALQAKVGAPALAVVADSLVEAIGLGKPYSTQVEALGPLDADPAKIAVLKENADKGVPSAQTLSQKFAPLADPIMAMANKAPPNAGLMDKLKSGMFSMVSVRSADATAGDDVGSRVSRIEADLAHDDVTDAYATWDGLPADAKAKSDAWGALAKTHVEAISAARALQQQAIAALGSKKS